MLRGLTMLSGIGSARPLLPGACARCGGSGIAGESGCPFCGGAAGGHGAANRQTPAADAIPGLDDARVRTNGRLPDQAAQTDANALRRGLLGGNRSAEYAVSLAATGADSAARHPEPTSPAPSATIDEAATPPQDNDPASAPGQADAAAEPPAADKGSVGFPGQNAGVTEDEQALEQIRELEQRDREVRSHEQAHISAGGSAVSGGARYEYTVGPDGKQYAVGGEVSIDTSPVPGNPEATIEKAQTVRRAALAPATPSSQDQKVAAQAAQMEAEARMEKIEEQRARPEGAPEKGNVAPGEASQAQPVSAQSIDSPLQAADSNVSTTTGPTETGENASPSTGETTNPTSPSALRRMSAASAYASRASLTARARIPRAFGNEAPGFEGMV